MRALRAAGLVMGWCLSMPIAQAAMDVLPPQPIPWVIDSGEYSGEVVDQIARMEARYTIQVLRDGWIEVPIGLAGVTITDIAIEKKTGEAHIVPRAGFYAMTASRKGTYKIRVKFSQLLTQDSQSEGVQLSIPRATFSTLSLFVPRKDVELRPQDRLYVDSKPDGARGGVKLTARLGAAEQIDLRWRTKPATPEKIEPVLYGEVNTLVTIEEQLARLTSIIQYRLAQGETKELQVVLPASINVLNVRGAGVGDWHITEGKDHKMLVVTLNFSLKDAAYQLVIEGEQPIAVDATSYNLPEITLTAVKQERGYVAVSRSGSIEVTAGAIEGINRVDVKELPDAIRSAASSSAMLAFKYHQHPYSASLTLTRHDDHAVLAAIAEQGELVTVLSRQGELLTRASYLIKANKKQFLEVMLPNDATLWSCLVNGKSVKPVDGKEGKLLIPLDAMADSTSTVPVELVYFERYPQLTGIGQLNLQGPILDVPTTVSNWFVYTPSDVKFLRMSGTMDQGAARYAFLNEPFMQVAYAQERSQEEGRAYLKRGLEISLGAISLGATKHIGSAYDPNYADSAYTRTAGVGGIDEGKMDAPRAARQMESFSELQKDFDRRSKESGILPLKIQLPAAGTIHRFHRLMTTNEALQLHATFVHVPMPQVPWIAVILILGGVGGTLMYRRRFAK